MLRKTERLIFRNVAVQFTDGMGVPFPRKQRRRIARLYGHAAFRLAANLTPIHMVHKHIVGIIAKEGLKYVEQVKEQTELQEKNVQSFQPRYRSYARAKEHSVPSRKRKRSVWKLFRQSEQVQGLPEPTDNKVGGLESVS